MYSPIMTATPAELPPLTGDMTMSAVLSAYPGAQRALFARYHIGGCSSCGFQPTETLAGVCARNDNVSVEEAIRHIQESHEADSSLQISPAELASRLTNDPGLKILDARTREEHEAVRIPGSMLITQEFIQEIFSTWDKSQPLVIYDHQGRQTLDAVAYFIGHGFTEARALNGGIDAYSEQIDPSLPRYRIELED